MRLKARRMSRNVNPGPLLHRWVARAFSLAHPKSQAPELWSWMPRRATREGLVLMRHVREGRFQRSLAFITAGSSLLAGLEVAYEHYRGSYSQRKMYSPVVLGPAVMLAAGWCVWDRRAARWALPATSILLSMDGLLGFFFHVRGIARKPGGWRLPVTNITMGPPLFAPLLLAMPGYLGIITSYLRREDDPRGRFLPWPRGLRSSGWLAKSKPWRGEIREGRFQRHMALAAAVSSLLSGAEAFYSHYKSNFRFKAQWTPVLVAPALAAAGFAAIISPRAARTWLPVTSGLAVADGLAGFGYHLRGVLRRPGGLQLSFYNLLYGPPVFAPLLFAGAGFLGLLASLLRRKS